MTPVLSESSVGLSNSLIGFWVQIVRSLLDLVSELFQVLIGELSF